MKSKQVLSIDQMKHLRELGLDTSDASMYWARVSHGSRVDDKSKGKWFLSLQKEFQVCGFMSYESIPTYTLQDILDKLPSYITYNDEEYQLQILPPCICYRYVNYTFDDLDYKNNVVYWKTHIICFAGALEMDILKRVNNESENKRNWRNN